MSEMFNKAMPRVSFCDSNVRLGDVVGFLKEGGVYPAVVVAVVDGVPVGRGVLVVVNVGVGVLVGLGVLVCVLVGVPVRVGV